MKSFFIGLWDAMIESRHEKAQREIAYMLWSSEYKHESYDYILTMVKMGKVHELGASFAK
jgi:hypothetical protein